MTKRKEVLKLQETQRESSRQTPAAIARKRPKEKGQTEGESHYPTAGATAQERPTKEASSGNQKASWQTRTRKGD